MDVLLCANRGPGNGTEVRFAAVIGQA